MQQQGKGPAFSILKIDRGSTYLRSACMPTCLAKNTASVHEDHNIHFHRHQNHRNHASVCTVSLFSIAENPATGAIILTIVTSNIATGTRLLNSVKKKCCFKEQEKPTEHVIYINYLQILSIYDHHRLQPTILFRSHFYMN